MPCDLKIGKNKKSVGKLGRDLYKADNGELTMLTKAFAFLKKDFLMESSYRFAFFFNFFGILVSILSYYFIDKLFGNKIVPHLEAYGVNYFAYVLLSSAFFGYVGVGVGSFSERIRAEQQQGTLEALLLTPTGIPTILLSLALWNLVLATLDLLAGVVPVRELARVSVVGGREPVTIVPAADDLTDVRRAIAQGGTVVLMKIGKRLPEVLDLLDREGLLERSVFISRVGMETQRIETDLRRLKVEGPEAGYLSIILVHAF